MVVNCKTFAEGAMDYWHAIEKIMLDGPFKVQVSYRYSDEDLSHLYPDDTPDQIREQYEMINKHESFLFDVRIRYLYANEVILSETSRYSCYYNEFPEKAILAGLDGEIELMMIEGKEKALEKAKNLLDNLQNDFGEGS